tara:strand:+ start:18 stop:518 length:501 start_codon:yes stop_codon:yes gene_type:complete
MIDSFVFLYDKITKELVLVVAVPVAIVLAAAFSWDMGLRRTTLAIGQRFGNVQNAQVFQDAVTPPWQTNATLFIWALLIVFFSTCFFRFGIITSVLLLLIFFAAVVTLGKWLLPKAESRHYLYLVFQSLLSRLANFQRDQDSNRAEAAEELVQRMIEDYGAKLLRT